MIQTLSASEFFREDDGPIQLLFVLITYASMHRNNTLFNTACAILHKTRVCGNETFTISKLFFGGIVTLIL